MNKNYWLVELPTGSMEIDNGTLEIAHCQVMASTPENALKPAFIITQSERSADPSDMKWAYTAEPEDKASESTEQPGPDTDKLDEGESSSREACSKCVQITNVCVKGIKIVLHIHNSRFIKAENANNLWFSDYLSVSSIPGGLKLYGSSTVIKDFEIGETIEIEDQDTVMFIENDIITFKYMEKSDTFDISGEQQDYPWDHDWN